MPKNFMSFVMMIFVDVPAFALHGGVLSRCPTGAACSYLYCPFQ